MIMMPMNTHELPWVQYGRQDNVQHMDQCHPPSPQMMTQQHGYYVPSMSAMLVSPQPMNMEMVSQGYSTMNTEGLSPCSTMNVEVVYPGGGYYGMNMEGLSPCSSMVNMEGTSQGYEGYCHNNDGQPMPMQMSMPSTVYHPPPSAPMSDPVAHHTIHGMEGEAMYQLNPLSPCFQPLGQSSDYNMYNASTVTTTMTTTTMPSHRHNHSSHSFPRKKKITKNTMHSA